MNVVSFGGGTNSTAMIIGMYLHKIPIDLILFADTGGEQPHTYEFMANKEFEEAQLTFDQLFPDSPGGCICGAPCGCYDG